jgi:hypothetical protein
MQEELALAVLPDPTLTVHDIVELASNDRAAGRWAVSGLEWGMTVEDPLVRIAARRTVGSGVTA